MFLDMTNENLEKLDKIRAIGLKIALDDFGTGYSSLQYLSKIPVNYLKIDKTLIDDIVNDNKVFRMNKMISSISKDMNIETVAEGVETIEQLEILKNLECNYIQEYLLSKPVSETDIIKLIKEDS